MVHLKRLMNEFNIIYFNMIVSYHHRENDGSHGGLEDPEHSQAKHLDEGEEVNLPEGNMA